MNEYTVNIMKALRSYALNIEFMQPEVQLRLNMLAIKLKNQSVMVKDLQKPYEKVTQEVEQLMS